MAPGGFTPERSTVWNYQIHETVNNAACCPVSGGFSSLSVQLAGTNGIRMLLHRNLN